MDLKSSFKLALLALGLSACAHANTEITAYQGGRAGQPNSWLPSAGAEHTTFAQPLTAHAGGRAGQPQSWAVNGHTVGSDLPRGEAVCSLGGRAGQPQSGPTVLLDRVEAPSRVAQQCDANAPRHF